MRRPAELPAERTLVRGLFSGGTLCYESLVILSEVLGPVYSNTPLDKSLGLPVPPGAHSCLDLGEEEYTKGRPHPMIDPEARIELLREQGADPSVAVIILDVVLGYGAHPDPAAELAPICAEITAGGGPRIVIYVLGTDADPQGYAAQRRGLRAGGLPGHRDRGARLAGRRRHRQPPPASSPALPCDGPVAGLCGAVAGAVAGRVNGSVAEAGTGSGGRGLALVTHSTKPRGGLVHTLSLAEAAAPPGCRRAPGGAR